MKGTFLSATVLLLLALTFADAAEEGCSSSDFNIFNSADPGPYVPCLQDPCADDSEDVALVNCTLDSHCALHNSQCYAKQRSSQDLSQQFGLLEIVANLDNTTTNETDARSFPIGGLPLPGGLGGLPGGLGGLPGGAGGLPGGLGGLPGGLGGLPGGLGGLPGGLGGLPGGLGGLPGGLGGGLPSLPTICPSSFPATCNINAQTPNLLQLLEPPVNVPYCLRIPCSTSNPTLERNRYSCISVPGCYFDLGLANLRGQYGNHIMPGVPVCHLAIRNRKFQHLANNYLQRTGKRWNGVYTSCFLRENRNEIYSSSPGCYQITMMQYMGVQPKIAGWPGITSGECYLIDGCPLAGGCYRPGQLNRAQVRSGSDPTRTNSLTGHNYYGQPMCMNYNPTTPQQYLTGYHQCRQAGCVVDPSISNQVIRQQFYQLATTLPLLHQRPFWNGVLNNQIRPDNYQQHLTPSACSNLATNPTTGPFSLNLSGRKKRNVNLGLFGPSSPGGFGIPTPVPQCPYQTFNGRLTGSTAGCCQRNYCYMPRSHILRSASGIATYRGNWGEFEACSVSCGGGTRKRTRPCIRYHANDTCEHESEQIHRCNVDACPNFGSWTPYGQCSSTCGAGTRTRSRPCLPAGSTCADDSQGGATQSQPCNNGACPVYAEWSQWGQCNAQCGFGEQSRSRTCTDVPGGVSCNPQLLTETKSCEIFCGSCQTTVGNCQAHPKCYKATTIRCEPDATGAAHCNGCTTSGTVTYERCSQGGIFCLYCNGPWAAFYNCQPLPQ